MTIEIERLVLTVRFLPIDASAITHNDEDPCTGIKSFMTQGKMQDIGIAQLNCGNNIPDIQLLPGAVSEILASVRDTGVLTKADCYGLMAASLDESLNEEDRRSVNRLMRSVLKGRVQMTDCLSVVAYSLDKS